MAKANYIKYSTQNPIDFTLTNYGSIDNLFDFIKEAELISYSDFFSTPKKSFKLNEIPSNEVTSVYRSERNVISTMPMPTYSGSATCNNDLTFKTIVGGDFNDDYNNDFSKTSLDTIVVGYEGMDLYCYFSIYNSGNKDLITTGSVILSGVETKNYSGTIRPNETNEFQVIFENVQSGSYTVTLEGDCPQSRDIEVLGNTTFVCNNDLVILETAPYYVGDTVTLEWSVTNSGSASGIYDSNWFINEAGTIVTKPVSVLISTGDTYTFSKEVELTKTGIYEFTSTCNQKLSITVESAILTADIVYNNDLQILEGTINNGDTITVHWSLTNNGSIAGTTNGKIQYTPDDLLNIQDWSETPRTVAPGETVVYEKQYTVFGGDHSFILSGDAFDILDFTVDADSIYKLTFWSDLDGITPFDPTPDAPPLVVAPNTVVFFHCELKNPQLVSDTVNVKMVWNSYYTFINVNKTIESLSIDNTISYGLGSNISGNSTVDLYLDDIFIKRIYYTIT